MWNNSVVIAKVNYIDLCLIPKVPNPQIVNQFRLISLCYSIYKVLRKIIVNRLKMVIYNIISPYQTGSQLRVYKKTSQWLRKWCITWIKLEETTYSLWSKLILQNPMIWWVGKLWIRCLSRLRIPDKLRKIIMESISTTKMTILWKGQKQ